MVANGYMGGGEVSVLGSTEDISAIRIYVSILLYQIRKFIDLK